LIVVVAMTITFRHAMIAPPRATSDDPG